MPDLGIYGMPGIGSATTAYHRRVMNSGVYGYLGGGRVLDHTKTRDPGNVGYETCLRAGLLIGRSTANTLKYGASIVGMTSAALTNTGTTLSVTAESAGAQGVAGEIVRRFGASGSFKLTGPPTAAGTVRTLLVAYSSVNLTTGAITITAAGVNEVNTIAIGGTISAGNIWFRDAITGIVSRQVAFNAAVGAVQAALDDVFGAANTVASDGIAASFTVTFAGTLAGTAMVTADGAPRLQVINGLTNTNMITITRTTAGVDGRFVSGSLIQPNDGTETPMTFIPDGYPTQMRTHLGAAVDTEMPKMPTEGEIDGPQLINWPADTALQAWLMNQLSTQSTGKFVFANKY